MRARPCEYSKRRNVMQNTNVSAEEIAAEVAIGLKDLFVGRVEAEGDRITLALGCGRTFVLTVEEQ